MGRANAKIYSFQGSCVAELKQSLQDSVEDYLRWCAEEGVEPEKPYTGKFVVRLSPDLHRRISLKARAAGVSLNQWVSDALTRESREEYAVPGQDRSDRA